MKIFKLIIVGFLLFFAVSVQAQISVHVNLGSPPQWGPVGYSDVRYYYLPDVEAYYDIPSSMFIYYNGVTWVHRRSLPTRYRSYDLYDGYKVPMSDYRGNNPYSKFRQHKMQYARGYRGQEQHNIGERPQRGNYNEGNYSKSHNDQKISRSYHGGDKRDNDKSRKKDSDRGHGNGKNK